MNQMCGQELQIHITLILKEMHKSRNCLKYRMVKENVSGKLEKYIIHWKCSFNILLVPIILGHNGLAFFYCENFLKNAFHRWNFYSQIACFSFIISSDFMSQIPIYTYITLPSNMEQGGCFTAGNLRLRSLQVLPFFFFLVLAFSRTDVPGQQARQED